MSKILNVIIIVGLLVIVLVVAFVGYDVLSKNVPQSAPVQNSTAQPAEDFTVYDLDGNAHKLSDFRGKPVVLNFWASWCGPCKSEMPDFEKAYRLYGEEVQFLMVNLTDGYQETKQAASSFIAGTDYTFPVYYDTDLSGAEAYGVTSIPVTYFIDAQGNLISSHRGMLSAENLEAGIGMISR